MSAHVALAEYLGSAVDDLAYTAATNEGNVFVDNLPTTPDRAVGVFTSPSEESELRLEYDRVDLQILVRCEKGGTWALDHWEAVYAELHGLRNYTLPDGMYLAFLLGRSSSPQRLADDEVGRICYSGEFHAEIINASVKHR